MKNWSGWLNFLNGKQWAMVVYLIISLMFVLSSMGCLGGGTYSGTSDDLMLNSTDIPISYSVGEKGTIPLSEIDVEGTHPDWHEGYFVVMNESSLDSGRYIEQSVFLFPLYDVLNIFAEMETVMNSEGYISEKLPNPMIGDRSRAFSWIENGTGIKGYTIHFTKMGVINRIVYFSANGTGDYALLKSLAVKAEEKIE